MGRDRRRGGSASRDDVDASGLLDGDVLDQFTTIDERLSETEQALTEVVKVNRSIADALAAATGQDVDLPTKADRPLVADAVIEPQLADGVSEPSGYDGNEVVDELSIPTNGTVTRITPVFPQGANQSIGIGIDGTDGENLVPFGPPGVNYLALDDQAPDFNLDYDASKEETLTARFINERVAQDQQEIDELTAYASAIVVVTEEV